MRHLLLPFATVNVYTYTFDDVPKFTTLVVGYVKGGDILTSTEVDGDCIERVSPMQS